MQPGSLGKDLDDLVLLPELPCEKVSDFGRDGWPSHALMVWWWLGSEAWLMARGITLNPQPVPNLDAHYKTWSATPHAAPGPCKLPYAYCMPTEYPQVQSQTPWTKLAWSQDSARRDVVLKLVNTDTDEYQVCFRLLQSSEEHCLSSCCGVLRPVAIFETQYNFSFVVIPQRADVRRTAHPRRCRVLAPRPLGHCHRPIAHSLPSYDGIRRFHRSLGTLRSSSRTRLYPRGGHRRCTIYSKALVLCPPVWLPLRLPSVDRMSVVSQKEIVDRVRRIPVSVEQPALRSHAVALARSPVVSSCPPWFSRPRLSICIICNTSASTYNAKDARRIPHRVSRIVSAPRCDHGSTCSTPWKARTSSHSRCSYPQTTDLSTVIPSHPDPITLTSFPALIALAIVPVVLVHLCPTLFAAARASHMVLASDTPAALAADGRYAYPHASYVPPPLM
ncbi:hypothetical protein C8Q73DRAFT_693240 [Cubamyces lactineus]|nr:hypothetical protein C8Q73DRAFT_693240 [Cubamyces lactineus]